MAPRIHGIREHRDKTWYDTDRLEPGDTKYYFGGGEVIPRLGDLFQTNMQTSGEIPGSDTSYVLMAIGVRCLGKKREEEELLLDYLHIQFDLGAKPQFDMLGPQASMLRHIFSRDELKRLEREADLPPVDEDGWMRFIEFCRRHNCTTTVVDRDSAQVAQDELLGRGLRPPIYVAAGDNHPVPLVKPHPLSRVGYHLARPVIIPVRQNFEVVVSADPRLSEPVDLRIHLFGLETRDVN